MGRRRGKFLIVAPLEGGGTNDCICEIHGILKKPLDRVLVYAILLLLTTGVFKLPALEMTKKRTEI
jgi:hypothetical protein